MSNSAYLVRLKDTHELVGFGVANSLKDLFWLVDENVDPFACEYRRVENAMIFDTQTKRDAKNKIGASKYGWDEYGENLNQCETFRERLFSERLCDVFWSDQPAWKSFPFHELREMCDD